jgi:hypothetical protein
LASLGAGTAVITTRPLLASEKATKLFQTLGQLQPFIAVFQQECMGQLAFFEPT